MHRTDTVHGNACKIAIDAIHCRSDRTIQSTRITGKNMRNVSKMQEGGVI